jgi:hypothetical protein
MRRLPLVLLALALAALAAARAQNVGLTHWRSGLIELNEDWAAQDGDDASWAKTDFDDSGWKTVDIEDQGPARQGWRWFRKRVKVGPDYTDVRLLIEGGDGTYELYVNGELQPGRAFTRRSMSAGPPSGYLRSATMRASSHLRCARMRRRTMSNITCRCFSA